MSALTVSAVANDKNAKKPQYKDYVSFLGNYKTGRKDDQCSVTTNDSGVSFSLTNSSNNSSSSINSDLTADSTPKNAFRNYLDQYNSKRFSSVQPGFVKKNGSAEETKTVKTEVYIEINQNPNLSRVSKVVQINPQPSNVSKVSKIFETIDEPAPVKLAQPSGKVNTFKFEQRDAEKEQKKTSIGKISTGHCVNKPPLKKTPSINEKTKLFEEDDCETKKEDTRLPKTTSYMPPKPIVNGVKPVFTSITKEIQIPTPVQAKPQSPPPPPPLVALNIPPPPPASPAAGIPPPPPPPPANFAPPKSTLVIEKPSHNKPTQNGKKADVVDGSSAPVTDKNDPRVKRMVYGALREMYGAYHDKANDYIATLPRNRVKKNNGLDEIINSIASQGGLEKLNGRVNPTVENE